MSTHFRRTSVKYNLDLIAILLKILTPLRSIIFEFANSIFVRQFNPLLRGRLGITAIGNVLETCKSNCTRKVEVIFFECNFTPKENRVKMHSFFA